MPSCTTDDGFGTLPRVTSHVTESSAHVAEISHGDGQIIRSRNSDMDYDDDLISHGSSYRPRSQTSEASQTGSGLISRSSYSGSHTGDAASYDVGGAVSYESLYDSASLSRTPGSRDSDFGSSQNASGHGSSVQDDNGSTAEDTTEQLHEVAIEYQSGSNRSSTGDLPECDTDQGSPSTSGTQTPTDTDINLAPRVSPEGSSPAHSCGTSPVVKRVHFKEPCSDDEAEVITPRYQKKVKSSNHHRNPDTHWFGKKSNKEKVKTQSSTSSSSSNKDEIRIISARSHLKNSTISNGSLLNFQLKAENNYKESSEDVVFASVPKKKDYFQGRSSCQWGCCCALGWFMLGIIALVCGALFVTYFREFQMKEGYHFERSLLYFGISMCILGGLSLLVGLGFFTCVSIVWEPNSSPSSQRGAKKYTINNDAMDFDEIIPNSSNKYHMTQPKEVISKQPHDVITSCPTTNYVPCVEYTERTGCVKESRGRI